MNKNNLNNLNKKEGILIANCCHGVVKTYELLKK